MATMPFPIAERVRRMPPPSTVARADRARELRRAGADVIELTGGEPDFDTPAHIVEAAERAMRDGFTHYVPSRGLPELLEAIAMKMERDSGLTYDPSSEILVAPSSRNAIYSTVQAVVDEGSDVLIVEPTWGAYAEIVRLAGGSPIGVPTYAAEGWVVTRERLEAALTPRCRVLMTCSPNNPTGHVMPHEELQVIADFAIAHNLLVIHDEMYEHIIYPPHKHISLATLPGMFERTVTQNGFSKAYAMTGWRLGYVCCHRDLLQEILKVHAQAVSCAASFVQKAGVAALTGPQEPVQEMVARYAQRRQLVAEGFNSLPGFKDQPVEGAFYAFPDIRGTGMSSEAMTNFLLERAHVAGAPGTACGASGEGHLRFSFAANERKLEEAIQRMAQALREG